MTRRSWFFKTAWVTESGDKSPHSKLLNRVRDELRGTDHSHRQGQHIDYGNEQQQIGREPKPYRQTGPADQQSQLLFQPVALHRQWNIKEVEAGKEDRRCEGDAGPNRKI